jgi:hypothetical protein
MAEYWKSTVTHNIILSHLFSRTVLILQQPKYWCKHCNTYVRDTKLERANHEATPKHQGNLKRFLRDLHRGHEKDEKDKERAKAEVARLNGMAAGGAAGSSSVATSSGLGRGPTPSIPKAQAQATPSQRKQQLSQLAELGISIPDGFRPGLAMAGEWQVTSERIIEREGGKTPESVALGVRKRVVEEDGEGEGEIAFKKKRWGSTYKTHPTQAEDEDLDALLNSVTRKDKPLVIKAEGEDSKEDIKKEPEMSYVTGDATEEISLSEEKLGIKKEPFEGDAPLSAAVPPFDDDVKQESEEQGAPGVVFRKRKAKNIRQK